MKDTIDKASEVSKRVESALREKCAANGTHYAPLTAAQLECAGILVKSWGFERTVASPMIVRGEMVGAFLRSVGRGSVELRADSSTVARLERWVLDHKDYNTDGTRLTSGIHVHRRVSKVWLDATLRSRADLKRLAYAQLFFEKEGRRHCGTVRDSGTLQSMRLLGSRKMRAILLSGAEPDYKRGDPYSVIMAITNARRNGLTARATEYLGLPRSTYTNDTGVVMSMKMCYEATSQMLLGQETVGTLDPVTLDRKLSSKERCADFVVALSNSPWMISTPFISLGDVPKAEYGIGATARMSKLFHAKLQYDMSKRSIPVSVDTALDSLLTFYRS